MNATVLQTAPDPAELRTLVASVRYRTEDGWKVWVTDEYDRGQGCTGTTLIVQTLGWDAYHPKRGRSYRVNHLFPVPAAAYNRQSWRRWVLDRIIEVETHEACEFFTVVEDCERCNGTGRLLVRWGLVTSEEDCRSCGGDGVVVTHPFAPNHGPGYDPYRIVEYETDEARRTRFTGEVSP